MTSLTKLPDIIFPLIQIFLSNDDYRYFLNSSKEEFADLKRRTIVFRLTESRSAQYMTDKEFQSLLLSKVADGWKQIELSGDGDQLVSVYDASIPHGGIEFDPSLHYCDVIESMEVLPPLSSHIRKLHLDYYVELTDVSSLSNLPKLSSLTMSELENLEDISPLKNIFHITLNGCISVMDFSTFSEGTVKSLELYECPLLVDVRGLRNLRTLELRVCHTLEDVSPLHGVYDLTICYCASVKDISSLGGHHRLEISNCSRKLKGYESLVGIPHVVLGGCDISDVSVLGAAKSVTLTACNEVTDVSPLRKVKKVVLDGMANIENISELGEVHDLSLIHVPLKEEEILSLRNQTLNLEFQAFGRYMVFESASCLNATKHLTLSNLSSLLVNLIETERFPFFKHLETLSIQNTSSLTMVKGLEDIPAVILRNLPKLSDISGLGRNRLVELIDCEKVKDVSSLTNVSIVRLTGCNRITDYSVLSKVARLKIDE